jgi:hypothetical protein
MIASELHISIVITISQSLIGLDHYRNIWDSRFYVTGKLAKGEVSGLARDPLFRHKKFFLCSDPIMYSSMTIPDAAERGRRLVQQRLGQAVLPPPSASFSNFAQTALKSEIETLELILSAKETELNLLRQQLIESNELLKSAQRLISERETSDTKKGDSLFDSVSNCPANKQKLIFSYLEKSLGVSDIEDLAKAIDKLAVSEAKYTEVVKAICIRDRLDMTKVSHQEIVQSLRSGEPVRQLSTSQEIYSRKGVAWTFH